MTQVVLDFLPGYFYDGHRVVSTGAAIPATQHIDKRTGELIYYLRPIFEHGATVGMFVRHKGIADYVDSLKA